MTATRCSGWPTSGSAVPNSAVSLGEIAALRLPLGLGIERDIGFRSVVPLSLWADIARATGSIARAEAALADTDRRLRVALTMLETDQLPPPDEGVG